MNSLNNESILITLLDPDSTRFKILESISTNGAEASSQEIAQKIDVAEKTVRNNLTMLRKAGLVERVSRDGYGPIPGLYPVILLMHELNKKIEETSK